VNGILSIASLTNINGKEYLIIGKSLATSKSELKLSRKAKYKKNEDLH